jgi:peptidoglycan hydrolase-like protein with peptidoglycan-binding domain
MKIGYFMMAGTAAFAIGTAAVAQQQGGQQSRDPAMQQGGQESKGQQPGGAQQGMSQEMVKQAQQALKDKGHDAGPVDGMWGPQTQQAVREFQQKEGIQATGRLDQKTLSALGMQEGTSAAGGSRAGQDKAGASSGGSSPAPGPAQGGSPSSPSGAK